MCAQNHTAADLPPGFTRLPEPLRGVRQNQHNLRGKLIPRINFTVANGGGGWIRTSVRYAGRFTVCCL